MELQQLKAFVEVVRRGSFAAAARALAVAPSAVTRAVAGLEDELGARLLNRTTRQLTLTEAGAAYVQRISPLLAELDEAADDVRERTCELRGSVRVTASVGFGQAVLVPLMPALHEAHPGLDVEAVLTDAVVDLVAQRIDLALRLGPAVDGSLVGLPLRPVRYRVVASPAYLQRHGRPRTPADLADCACLRFPLPGFRSAWRFRPLGEAQAEAEAVSVGGWFVASSATALRRAALEGLGPALLADWLIDGDVARGRLVDLFPGLEASAGQFDSAVWLLYPAREHLPRRVRAMVDFLKGALRA
jgi:DNA-binding transcriptional LysR family regulator